MIKSDKEKDVKMESIFQQVVIDGQVPASAPETCEKVEEVDEEEDVEEK